MNKITHSCFFSYKEVLSDALYISDLVCNVLLLLLLLSERLFSCLSCAAQKEKRAIGLTYIFISLQQLKFLCLIKLP